MKQKASTLGMTSAGSGHKRRLMREIWELLSRNIARRGERLARGFNIAGNYGPPTVKPLACQREIRAFASVGAVKLRARRAI